MDQILAALKGHAQWVRNYKADPSKYHQPSCSAETFDAAAAEIEKLRATQDQLTEYVRRHQQQISELMTENAGLRAALNPFAELERGYIHIPQRYVDAAIAALGLEQKAGS